MLEVGVPLFLTRATVSEPLHHRTAPQALLHHFLSSQPLYPLRHPPSSPLARLPAVDIPLLAPDCQAILQAWSQFSQDRMVVLDERCTILFASQQAAKQLSLQSGAIFDSEREQFIRHSWMIEEQPIEGAHRHRMLVFLPRTRILGQRQGELPFPDILTQSPLYLAQLRTARVAAQSSAHTLIMGQTGSGKEVLARAIHRASARKSGPFIAINIASLPRDLIASELFGYTEGSFTGARKGGQIGKFEAAQKGTLFLDEIGDMPPDLQVLLLRVLEDGKVTRLGSHEEKQLDVRIIAATNRNLEDDVKKGRFRADLFYRLHVLPIHIPPLCDRREDISLLAGLFLSQLQAQYGGGPACFSDQTVHALKDYDWPGNVRELRNVIERAFLLAFDETAITIEHLPIEWDTERARSYACMEEDGANLRDKERQLIERTIAEERSLRAAAKKLGIARSTLYRKLKDYQRN